MDTLKSYPPEVDDIISSPTIAGDVDVAGLGVQRKQFKVHGTPKSEGNLNKQSFTEDFLVERYLYYFQIVITSALVHKFSSSKTFPTDNHD